MSALTVTAKGQVTLRKDLLEHLGVAPGAKIDVTKLPNGELQVRAAAKTGQISDIFGIFERYGRRAFTIEEINDAIADGWAGKR